MSNFQSPVIGIIGGTGPDATVDILKKIFKAMRVKTGATFDQDHNPVLVDINTKIPHRSHDLLCSKYELLSHFISSATKLEKMGANIIAIACNTAHYLFPDIQRNISSFMVNMVEETVEYIDKNEITRVGLLATEATIKMKIYHSCLMLRNIEVIEPDKVIQEKISLLITCIKAGLWDSDFTIISDSHQKKIQSLLEHRINISTMDNTKDFLKDLLVEICHYFSKKGTDHIILGCTELPLLFNDFNFVCKELNFIDPNDILANKLVEYAMTINAKMIIDSRESLCQNEVI